MSIEFSVEFFPPAEEVFQETCNIIKEYVCNFPIQRISITHGASGGKKDKSLTFIRTILEKNIIEPQNITAHLSCAGLEKSEVLNYVEKFYNIGIREILVIKGDPTAIQVKNGYNNTSEAIADIKKQFHQIKIVAACFPEPRQGVEDEMLILKEKIAGGADRFISQFCFENHFFENFYQTIKTNGIFNEITVGLIIPSKQTLGFAQKCYAKIPESVFKLSESEEKSVNFVVEQLHFLEKIGYNSTHLYSLNKPGFAKVLEKYLK